MIDERSGTDSIPPETIQQFQEGLDYPASKDQLIRHAKERDAPGFVLSAMEKLPDQNFMNTLEVVQAVRTAQSLAGEDHERGT